MTLKEQFILNFIDDSRWKYLLQGLGNTLSIAFFAVLLGIVIGVFVAIIRSTFDKNRETLVRGGNALSYYSFALLNQLCKIYLTVIRGTHVVVQLFQYDLLKRLSFRLCVVLRSLS